MDKDYFEKYKDKLLLGKPVSNFILNDVKDRVNEYKLEYGTSPCLATIMVGEDSSSQMYVRMKTKKCKEMGINNMNLTPKSSTTEDLINIINHFNELEQVSGILIQHPLPRNIDEEKCFDAILPSKDVDGVNAHSFGDVCLNNSGFESATPKAIMNILDYYGVSVKGKHAVVVGRSRILGKPVASLLLNRDATVTVCHSKTKDLDKIIKQADILVACVGKKHMIKKEWIKDGAVVIDAGYQDGLGDVSPDAIEVASKMTPVPRGVGPVTIATLLDNVITAAELQKEKEYNKNNKVLVKERD